MLSNKLLAKKLWIVPIPGTTKRAHLQENLSGADFEFSLEELKNITDSLHGIKIVGERYTGETLRLSGMLLTACLAKRA